MFTSWPQSTHKNTENILYFLLMYWIVHGDSKCQSYRFTCDVQAKFSEAGITEEVPPLPLILPGMSLRRCGRRRQGVCQPRLQRWDTANGLLSFGRSWWGGRTVGTSEQKLEMHRFLWDALIALSYGQGARGLQAKEWGHLCSFKPREVVSCIV